MLKNYITTTELRDMDQNRMKEPIRQWLMRDTCSESFRQVTNFPLSLASGIGLMRSENQDRAVLLKAQVSSTKAFIVGVLCDGMGGMIDGHECASLAVASFLSNCIKNRNISIKDRLLKAVNSANSDIYLEYKGKGGATLSAFILDNNGGFGAINVGDSRTYAIIKNELVQISTDDTIAGQLKQDNDRSLLNNNLLQYLGIGEELEPHFLDFPELKDISKIILTSDGVHFIEHKILQAILLQNEDSAELSQRLISLSKWCGGNDNASVLLFNDIGLQHFLIDKVQTGSVQIWDAFGDLQLIGIEKATPQKALQQAELPFKQPVSKNEIIEKIKPNQSQNSDKVLSKKENKKPKPKKKSNKKNKETLKKPQLRIDFDD
jgi:serine/threonine protein phosphatase PrpC